MQRTVIRDTRLGDAAAIAPIYAHHVLHGTATFDLVPPSVADWEAKIAGMAERGWPFVVALFEGHVAGYAYAAPFRDRPAYAHSCENSVYVAAHLRGRGIGASLLPALCERALARGFEQMVAVIGGAEPASVALHARSGFVEAGRLRDIGHKFGRSLDTLYMQRDLRIG